MKRYIYESGCHTYTYSLTLDPYLVYLGLILMTVLIIVIWMEVYVVRELKEKMMEYMWWWFITWFDSFSLLQLTSGHSLVSDDVDWWASWGCLVFMDTHVPFTHDMIIVIIPEIQFRMRIFTHDYDPLSTFFLFILNRSVGIFRIMGPSKVENLHHNQLNSPEEFTFSLLFCFHNDHEITASFLEEGEMKVLIHRERNS